MNKDNFGLEYVNFWDDTHLCEEGAIKFTKQLFKNIDFHSKLIPKKLNLYMITTLRNKYY